MNADFLKIGKSAFILWLPMIVYAAKAPGVRLGRNYSSSASRRRFARAMVTAAQRSAAIASKVG